MRYTLSMLTLLPPSEPRCARAHTTYLPVDICGHPPACDNTMRHLGWINDEKVLLSCALVVVVVVVVVLMR